jgi:hypothetical protein
VSRWGGFAWLSFYYLAPGLENLSKRPGIQLGMQKDTLVDKCESAEVYDRAKVHPRLIYSFGVIYGLLTLDSNQPCGVKVGFGSTSSAEPE